MTRWRKWVEHPEQSWLRNILFQIHLMIGAAVSAYIVLMSISGSIIVWQNELYKTVPIEWLVKAHDNLLSGSSGRLINGVGGVCIVMLCFTGAVGSIPLTDIPTPRSFGFPKPTTVILTTIEKNSKRQSRFDVTLRCQWPLLHAC
jgi:hypothetical protein